MKEAVILERSHDDRRLSKSKIPNLFSMEHNGDYYGRVKVKGKVHKKSFDR